MKDDINAELYVLLVKFTCLPGKATEVRSLLDPEMLDQVKQEPGTLLYSMFTDGQDSDVLWFWMAFPRRQDFDEHNTSEVDQRASEAFRPLLAELEIRELNYIGGKGSLEDLTAVMRRGLQSAT